MDSFVNWNELLSQAQDGNYTARDRLCELLHARLLTVVQFRLRGLDKNVREDLVQEAMVTIIEKLDAIKENPHYFALIVLRNKIGDFLRHQKASAARIQNGGDCDNQEIIDTAYHHSRENGTDIEDDIQFRDLVVHIAKAINMLPPFCRAYFQAALSGFSVGEILQMLMKNEPNLSRSNFDSRVHRCRKKLMVLMHPQLNGRN